MLASLSLRQKVTMVVVGLLVAAAMVGFVRWRKESDFKPLYTGLAAEDSAAVVQKLKEGGAEYRLSETGAVISVPSAKLAELRLEMAAAGLPKTGRIGFEIFDKANLGATEFVEHVNYRRALEGELERSVAALAEVEQARVHVTFPKDSVFLESREPAKASVMVKLKPGAHLSPRNVTAIAHLVGSAVEGLSPEAVSVLDMQGNLLSQPVPSAEEAASEAALDYRQKLEHTLVQKINATLDPLLGHERYRAGVSVDCDITSGEQSEETVDPTHSVMLSSQKTEDLTMGAGSTGVPGTASNLPRPTSRPGSSGSSTTRRAETVTYESSRTIRKTKLPQGALKRLYVSVLLDQAVAWDGTGKGAHRVLTPPAPETMKSVRDLVATVVGFQQDRGDQITIETLPFESTLNLPPPEAPAAPQAPKAPASKWEELRRMPYFVPAAAGAGVLLLLLIGAAVFMMTRKGKGKKKGETAEVPKNLPAPGTPGAPAALPGGASATDQLQAQLKEQAAQQELADMAALASIKVPPVKTKKSEVLVKQLRENAKKDASTSAHVLQSWLHERG